MNMRLEGYCQNTWGPAAEFHINGILYKALSKCEWEENKSLLVYEYKLNGYQVSLLFISSPESEIKKSSKVAVGAGAVK